MANRSTRLILKNSVVPSQTLPASGSLLGEALVNLGDGIMFFSGGTSGSPTWVQSNNTTPGYFEVGSNLYQLKLRDKIIAYSGVTNLSGKFLSGTTSGFVLADISDIAASVDSYTTGATWNPNVLTINLNNGKPSVPVTIDSFTALTVNGNLTVTGTETVNNLTITGTGLYNVVATGSNSNEIVNYSSLTAYSQTNDVYVTGNTLTAANDNTATQSAQLSYHGTPIGGPYFIDTQNTYTTGGTWNSGTTAIDFVRNDGVTYSVNLSNIDVNDTYVTGGTVTSGGTLDLFRNDNVTVSIPGVTYWTSGSTGLNTIKAINNSGLDSTGDRAVSWGNGTLASGNDSTAWGTQTSATTTNSTALGYRTLASGLGGSFAQGNQTTASGYYSHSEGYQTTASGDYSHTEGSSTIASGVNSHAEGNGTTASGYSSHSQGSSTVASGNQSFAFGKNTTASGENSTASGEYTIASGKTSTASGAYTIAGGGNSSASGYHTSAFGTNSTASGYYTIALGGNSHAEGQNTVASGIASHAEGTSTTSSGVYSHAEGQNTLASGQSSHAEGSSTSATTQYSHAEGDQTIASGIGSHAEGAFTTASGPYSHAEGYLTTASANYAKSSGYQTLASGIGSTSSGGYTTASGKYSTAQGSGTTASGIASFASGIFSTAQTDGTFIHSENSLVTGQRSVVLGGQNITGSTNDTVYVPYLNLNLVPTLNNSNTQILSRNSSNGQVEYTALSAFTSLDTFVTGFTYNPASNTFTISQNQGQPDLTASINTVSGLTVSNLTQGRVVYVGAGGLLTDEAGFTYDESGNTLNVQNIEASGNVVIQGDLTVFGAAISAFTSNLYVEDPNITLNYNPTGSTTVTSVNAGLTIQDGNGIAAGDVNFDIVRMQNLTGLTVNEIPDVTEYTALTGYANRGWITQLNDIVIRSTDPTDGGSAGDINGVRVLAEFDTLDGGVY